jgi:hypothetical protein
VGVDSDWQFSKPVLMADSAALSMEPIVAAQLVVPQLVELYTEPSYVLRFPSCIVRGRVVFMDGQAFSTSSSLAAAPARAGKCHTSVQYSTYLPHVLPSPPTLAFTSHCIEKKMKKFKQVPDKVAKGTGLGRNSPKVRPRWLLPAHVLNL